MTPTPQDSIPCDACRTDLTGEADRTVCTTYLVLCEPCWDDHLAECIRCARWVAGVTI